MNSPYNDIDVSGPTLARRRRAQARMRTRRERFAELVAAYAPERSCVYGNCRSTEVVRTPFGSFCRRHQPNL